MKRHEFEYEALQMILNNKSDDFVNEMTEGELRENIIEFFNIWAVNRRNPEALSTSMSNFIAKIITITNGFFISIDDYLITKIAPLHTP